MSAASLVDQHMSETHPPSEAVNGWSYTFEDWQYRADKGLLRGEHAIAAALCRECSGTLPARPWTPSYERANTDCHCEQYEIVSVESLLASHGLMPELATVSQGVHADALGRIR